MSGDPPVYSYRSARMSQGSVTGPGAADFSEEGKEPSPVTQVMNQVFRVLVWWSWVSPC